MAISLVHTGATTSLRRAFVLQGMERGNAGQAAQRVTSLLHAGNPYALAEVESAQTKTKALIETLVVQKVELAALGMQKMKDLLDDAGTPPELRVKIAQDFFDRVSEISKVTKQEVNTTNKLQIPSHKAEHLMAAIGRAVEAASRQVAEIQSQERPILVEGPDVQG